MVRWLIPAAILLVLLCLAVSFVIARAVSPVELVTQSGNAIPASPPSSTTVAEQEQMLKEKIEAYSKRADDLQKLISILLGLSTIYAIALGLGAYASVQSNLQQAEKSITRLETLLKDIPGNLAEMQKASSYSSTVSFASGSLALALQEKYLADAEMAIEALLELRNGAFATDKHVNFMLGRLYKSLKRLSVAEEAMSSFIERKEKLGQGDDGTIADAYYNRACYQSLRWNGASPTDQTELRAGIERDLRRVFRLRDGYRADARLDGDFEAISSEVWFQQLTR